MSEHEDASADKAVRSEGIPEESGKTGWASRMQRKINTYEKPKKVTREDVLAKWDDSYDRRVELGQKAKKPSFISIAVTTCAVLGVIAIGLSSSNASADFDKQSAKNASQIAALKSELNQAETRATKVPTKTAAATFIKDANKAGQEMASLQNQMAALEGKPDSNKMVSLGQKMAKDMTKDTAFAASPWYTVTRDVANPYRNMKYTWSAQTPYAFENDGENIKVVWLCRDDKGVLLAWAIGKYDVASKKFDGMTWGATSAGSDRTGTSLDTNAPVQGEQK